MKHLTLLLLLVVTCVESHAQAKLLQTPGIYKPGYTLKLRQTVDNKTTMTISGKERTTPNTTITEYDYQVTEVLPGGNIKWRMSISRVAMQHESVGKKALYDSSDPKRDTSDMVMRMLAGMIGVPMQMTTKPNGEVISLSGADALFTKMAAEFRTKPELAALDGTLKINYGDTAMMRAMSNIWAYLPEKAVKVGDKWQMNSTLPAFSGMKQLGDYELISRDDRYAVISVKTTSESLPGKDAEIDMGMAKVKHELKGTGTSDITISQPDGVLVKSVQNNNLKGVMHMSTPSGTMDVPTSSVIVTTTERIQ